MPKLQTVYVETDQGGNTSYIGEDMYDDILEEDWEEVDLSDFEEIGETCIVKYYEYDGLGKIIFDEEKLGEGDILEEIERIEEIIW